MLLYCAIQAATWMQGYHPQYCYDHDFGLFPIGPAQQNGYHSSDVAIAAGALQNTFTQAQMLQGKCIALANKKFWCTAFTVADA